MISKKIWSDSENSLIFTLILKPVFALVSINMILLSRDLASPSSIETCLFKYQNDIISLTSNTDKKNCMNVTKNIKKENIMITKMIITKRF